ncbi:MAG: hypothetical protein J6P60_02580 [Lachnospiraceae bacterium]|nr:hypothetical protein [Lachnospiraceae bacterium]
MMILISYTFFSAILVGESLILFWEMWVLPLIGFGVFFAWYMHIAQYLSEYHRLWLYSLLMMATFFFYGIHETSTFDLAAVMTAVVFLYTMTGVPKLVTLCISTYYFTMLYDLIKLYRNGTAFDSLFITRTLLHLMLIYMVGWVSKVIMAKWFQVLGDSKEQIEELREATRRMDDFMANISHEIRTPINAVIGLASVVEKKETNEEIKKDIQLINSAGHRVAEQISDILDYTEIDMGKLAVSHENYMISSLVNDLVAHFDMDIYKGIELIFDIDANMPSELVGDGIKIKKIMWHLIVNALKYTPDGGVYVHIHSFKREYGVNLCIEITDTGIGMPEEEIENIFEKFYQADSGRTRVTGGLGLGLSIVQGFVNQMGGFLKIESKTGVGTTVTVSIPQAVSDEGSCMEVEGREKLCLAGFLTFADIEAPRVKEFYNEMIRNLVEGLSIPMHRVENMRDIERLMAVYNLTHLFIGQGEYELDPDYIEALTAQLDVVMIAQSDFEPRPASKVKIIRKPYTCFSVANLLIAAATRDTRHMESERFYCPGVRALVVDDE